VQSFSSLLSEVRACTICAEHIPHDPRPVVQAHRSALILVAGQAPGRRVHDSGIPFNDPSGDRLRTWLGLSRDEFYDPRKIALLPMGFCYPGKGPGGDLPPRPECAAAWRAPLLAQLTNVELTLAIGQYALRYHLPDARGSLTEIVGNWRDFGPRIMPLPHPSPRNLMWLRRNPWFEEEVVPELRHRVAAILRLHRR